MPEVAGDREAESNSVAVRTRTGEDLGAMPLEQFTDVVLQQSALGTVEADIAFEVKRHGPVELVIGELDAAARGQQEGGGEQGGAVDRQHGPVLR